MKTNRAPITASVRIRCLRTQLRAFKIAQLHHLVEKRVGLLFLLLKKNEHRTGARVTAMSKAPQMANA